MSKKLVARLSEPITTELIAELIEAAHIEAREAFQAWLASIPKSALSLTERESTDKNDPRWIYWNVPVKIDVDECWSVDLGDCVLHVMLRLHVVYRSFYDADNARYRFPLTFSLELSIGGTSVAARSRMALSDLDSIRLSMGDAQKEMMVSPFWVAIVERRDIESSVAAQPAKRNPTRL